MNKLILSLFLLWPTSLYAFDLELFYANGQGDTIYESDMESNKKIVAGSGLGINFSQAIKQNNRYSVVFGIGGIVDMYEDNFYSYNTQFYSMLLNLTANARLTDHWTIGGGVNSYALTKRKSHATFTSGQDGSLEELFSSELGPLIQVRYEFETTENDMYYFTRFEKNNLRLSQVLVDDKSVPFEKMSINADKLKLGFGIHF